jgi:hypothetical protein
MKNLISLILFSFLFLNLMSQKKIVIHLKMNDTLSSKEMFVFSYSIEHLYNKCFYAIKNFNLGYKGGCDINIEIEKKDEVGNYVSYWPYVPPHFDPYYGMQKRDTKYCNKVKLIDTLYKIIYRIDKGNFRAKIYYYNKINLKNIKFKRLAESNWCYFNVPKVYNFSGF